MLVTLLCSLTLFGCTLSSPALILTSLVNQNRTEEARNASAVDSNHFLNIKSFSGFLNVEEDANLFFWYFPASDVNAPWVLWLQSEVGLTSLIGLFTNNGPFYHQRNKSRFATVDSLKERKYSWTKHFSMVFLDNCVTTGYSFGNAFPRNEEMYSTYLLNAVQQLVQIYPELSTAPLYLAGEGFAGHFIPDLAMKIHEAKNHTTSINLQGLLLGNPMLNAESIQDYISVFFNFGLIDRQGALAAQPLQERYLEELLKDRTSSNAFSFRENLLQFLEQQSGKMQSYSALKEYNQNELNYTFFDYLMREEILEALHVGDITAFAVPVRNYSSIDYMKDNFLANVTEKIVKLLELYRILIYCGQLSLSTPCVPMADHIRNTWYWKERNEFLNAPRLPWWLNEKIGGYVKSGGNLMEVLITNTGDLISIDKPEELLHVITNFIKKTEKQFLYPSSYLIENIVTVPYVDAINIESGTNKFALTISVIVNVILILFLMMFGILLVYIIYTTKINRSYVHQATINIRL